MSEEKEQINSEEVGFESASDDEAMQESDTEPETASDAQQEFSENYRKLPVWKQVILLVLFLGGMTAVIMLINFIVEFGAELIKSLLK